MFPPTMSLYFYDPQAAESEETFLLLLLGVYVLGLFGGWRGVSGVNVSTDMEKSAWRMYNMEVELEVVVSSGCFS